MTGADLLFNLVTRITLDPVTECWNWTGALSQSGWRGVFYPAVRVGFPPRRVWRVNRLILILYTGPKEYPQWPEEPFPAYLERLRACYQHAEAAHSCDHSLCINPEHLEWKGHRDNIQEQAARRRVAQEPDPAEVVA